MENKAIELLRKLRAISNGSSMYGARISNAVSISPAQQLRNSADEIERTDILLREVDDFLLEHLNK